jgi:hypothetical protein
MRLMVPKNNDRTPAAAELLFAALHGVFNYSSKVQPEMSFEIVSINKFIQFYFSVPRELREFVEGQFYAQYPTVEISQVDDYTQKVFEEKYVVGYDVQTTKEDVYPIKTFQNFDVDPLSGITSVLSQLGSNEEVWIQVCISPVADTWQKKAISYVKAIHSGRDPNEPFWKTILKGMGTVAQSTAQATMQSPTSAPKQIEISGPASLAMSGIEAKATKLGFKTKMRVVSLSGDYTRSRQNAHSIAGALKQYNTTNMNGFIQGNLVEGAPIVDLYRRRTVGNGGYILNIEEIASIFHLPGVSVETPAMDWAGSKKGEPPQNLPVIDDPLTSEDTTIIGKTNFRNVETNFGIKMRDRALHIYTIGKTGTGKSTLLSNLIIDDIIKGRGVAVVDPHGDLINDVMEYIPQERVEDVVYFSPADRNYPIGFNLLESVDPEYKNIVASGIVGIFKKIFGESWGPRLEYILRNVVLGLLDYPSATMLSIIKVLTDTKFRRQVIEKIDDPIIKDFFLNEYERYDQKFRTEAVAPIQNKVGQFLSSTIIRNIVGQETSTIDIRKIMDEQKILLIDLSMGKIGEDNSALLGSMLITKIQMAAMSRADMPKHLRVPFYLYVDEFQNFATDSFAVILSEARKYGLSLMMANQYIAQMPENVANAVFGNVGSIIAFRVGAQDADSLQREFMPVFEAQDLINQDNYNIYIKMAIDGVTSAPFSSRTVMPLAKKSMLNESIIENSRAKYSMARAEIEQQIKEKTEGMVPPQNLISQISFSGDSVNMTPSNVDQAKTEDVLKINPKEEKACMPVSEMKQDGEQRQLKDDQVSDLPAELANAKQAEDYDLKKWYFITRTAYKKVTGRGDLENQLQNDRKSDKKGSIEGTKITQ